MIPLLKEPFFQVTLPMMVAIAAAVWGMVSTNNRRLDDVNLRLTEMASSLNRRLDEIIVRLGRIEVKLDDHEGRITRLEERTSPIRSGK